MVTRLSLKSEALDSVNADIRLVQLFPTPLPSNTATEIGSPRQTEEVKRIRKVRIIRTDIVLHEMDRIETDFGFIDEVKSVVHYTAR